VSGKGTRITVDLGSEELSKALKIAAVQQGRTVRDIVVEALNRWLEGSGATPGATEPGSRRDAAPATTEGKDYKAMLETLNRYRGLGPR